MPGNFCGPVPIDVIVCDFFHWPRMGDYRFDEEFFPDPDAIIKIIPCVLRFRLIQPEDFDPLIIIVLLTFSPYISSGAGISGVIEGAVPVMRGHPFQLGNPAQAGVCGAEYGDCRDSLQQDCSGNS